VFCARSSQWLVLPTPGVPVIIMLGFFLDIVMIYGFILVAKSMVGFINGIGS